MKDPDYVDDSSSGTDTGTDTGTGTGTDTGIVYDFTTMCANWFEYHENPNPEECNTFYQCQATDNDATLFLPVKQNCPDGLVWRQSILTCDRPTPSDCIKPADLCPADGVHPNSNDCTHYFMCVWGTPYLMTCPAGTLFNPEALVCDWPSSSNSCSNSKCALNPDESYTFNQVAVGVSCGADDLGKSKAYPQDATGQTFVFCTASGPVISYCCEGKTAQIGSMGVCA